MKIYEVEEVVGVTKKNIRFYEEEGLLVPKKDPDSGFREYTLNDVHQLERITLLRKLGVSVEEIKLLQQDKLSFDEVMNHQINNLEKRKKDSQIKMDLCCKMKDEIEDFSNLEAESYLHEMQTMETEGTEFVDFKRQDINKKTKSGFIVATVFFCLLLIGAIVPVILIMLKDPSVRGLGFTVSSIMVLVISGVIALCVQHVNEVEKLDPENVLA